MSTHFDQLIEGQLHAVRDNKTGTVLLYALDDTMAKVIAIFYSEDAFSLINGYHSAESFNAAMVKRRRRTAAEAA